MPCRSWASLEIEIEPGEFKLTTEETETETTETMNESSTRKRFSLGSLVTITLVAAVATAFALYLLTDIFEKKQEAKLPFSRVVELTDRKSTR